MTKGSAIQKLASKLALIEMFNHGCVTDLEHSTLVFWLGTLLLMEIYHHVEFGRNGFISLELIKDIVEMSFFDYISPHCEITFEGRIPIFCMTLQLMMVHRSTKFDPKKKVA